MKKNNSGSSIYVYFNNNFFIYFVNIQVTNKVKKIIKVYAADYF